MAYNKESTKTSFYELAPSLQQKINDLAVDNQFQNTKKLINEIYGRMGDMVITEAFNRPVNGTTLGPKGTALTIANNKAVHLDLSDQVIEGYYGNAWNRTRIIYST